MNASRFTSYVLLAAIFWVSGCATQTPDPLAGWKVDFDHQPSQTIVNDYQDYIQKLPPKESGYVGTIFFLKDGTGKHAVSIEIFSKYTNASWHYALIYDKENTRIKAIKYDYSRFMS